VGKAAQFWGGHMLKIDADPAFAFDGPFSIAMFARDDSMPSGESKTLIGKPVSPDDSANILELLLFASGNGPPRELSAAIQSPDWTPTRVEIETPLVQQEWHHLAMVWDGEALEMYVDGQSVGSSTGPSPSTDLQSIAIGGDLNFGSPDNLWEGAIDELRIYDRALSPADVENLANAQ
jgi:hypothetical protein